MFRSTLATALALFASHAPNTAIAVTVGCFQEGECTDSLYLGYTDTADAQACLEFCRDTLSCSTFTHYSDSGACFAFNECSYFDSSSCYDCLSGEATCPDLR